LDDLYALRNPRPDAIFLGIVRVDIVQQYFTESFEQHDVSEFFSFLMDWVDNEHMQAYLVNQNKDLDIISSPSMRPKSPVYEQTGKYYITKEGEGYCCTRKKSLLKTNTINANANTDSTPPHNNNAYSSPNSSPKPVQLSSPIMERKLGTLFQQNPFSGILKSSLRCKKNKHQSDTYSNFLHLSMSINSSLTQCFNDFIRQEEVDYECEDCHDQKAIKQLSVAHPPKILAVHFQRLVGSFYGTKKTNGLVHYDLEFDIAPFCTTAQCIGDHSVKVRPIPILYDLLAIIAHFGGSGGGHYVTYKRLRDQNESSWLMISDDQICSVPESEALSNKSAFMLIYCKRE
jgi:ubiquitin C-terminal hydrolase